MTSSDATRCRSPPSTQRCHHVAVIVLGDVGRSPRMQYHTLSLLQHGYQVSLLGYKGENLIPALTDGNDNHLLNVIRFQPCTPWKIIRERFKPLYYLIRFVELVRVLCYALFMQVPSSVDCVLVQNPPSLPLLCISFLFCRLYGAGLIIDWHNLGYTMLDLPDRHPIRRFVFWYEKFMSHLADGHFCVTKAMKEFVHQAFQVATRTRTRNAADVCVLYDRPPDFFHRATYKERVNLMKRLDVSQNQCSNTCTDKHVNTTNSSSMLPSTFPARDLMLPQDQRMTALVMSCTSWTPDEDFNILLDALAQLDQMATRCHAKDLHNSNNPPFPKVAVVVTGKGPQRSMYQNKIFKIRPALKYITIDTMW